MLQKLKDFLRKVKEKCGWNWLILIYIAIFATLIMLSFTSENTEDHFKTTELKAEGEIVTYGKLESLIESGEVTEITVDNYTQTYEATLKDGSKVTSLIKQPSDNLMYMREKGILVNVISKEGSSNKTYLYINLFFNIAFLGAILYLSKILVSSVSSSGSNANSKFDVLNPDDLPKEDVAGLDSIVQDIDDVISMLKSREELELYDIKAPKGILLCGPPGVGKTLIAKRIAKQADLPFISCSGSDFVEMFVGMGARRVRELFKNARKQEGGCVIFIDEVDSLAKSRNNSNGSSSEDDKTLNAILKEMDGIGSASGILVVAATNLESKLDSAFTRPGRFDRTITILPPINKKDREAIIDVHLKNKSLSDDFDKEFLVNITKGMTGANISNIINSAATKSVIDGRNGIINNKDIEVSIDKILMKGNPLEREDNKSDWRVAVHEAGHAVMALVANKDVLKLSIIGTTSGIGGVTFSTDKGEEFLKSKSELELDISELYGGIIAETMILGEPSLGASNDIERATNLIANMVGVCGIEGTYLNMTNLDNSTFTKMCREYSSEIQVKSKQIMEQNKSLLLEIANDVMENKTIYNLNAKYESKVKRPTT